MTIPQLMRRIADAQGKFEDAPQPPCSGKDQDQLRAKVRKRFDADLPDAYLALLSVADGVIYNGVEVFGSKRRAMVTNRSVIIDGILEANRDLRLDRGEDVASLLVFARSEMDLWALDLESGAFTQHSHSGDEIATFDSFEAMMTRTFKSRLPA